MNNQIKNGSTQKPILKNYVFLIGRFKQVTVADYSVDEAYEQVKSTYRNFTVSLLRVV
ncbi:MAG: hypothetical protein ACO1N8_11330 [Methylophilus sp.]